MYATIETIPDGHRLQLHHHAVKNGIVIPAELLAAPGELMDYVLRNGNIQRKDPNTFRPGDPIMYHQHYSPRTAESGKYFGDTYACRGVVIGRRNRQIEIRCNLFSKIQTLLADPTQLTHRS